MLYEINFTYFLRNDVFYTICSMSFIRFESGRLLTIIIIIYNFCDIMKKSLI